MKITNKNNLLATLLLCSSSATFAKGDVDVVTTVSVGVTNIDLNLSELYLTDPLMNNGFLPLGDYLRSSESAPQIQGAEIGVTLIDDDIYYGFSTLLSGQGVSEYSSEKYHTLTDVYTTLESSETVTRSSYSFFLGRSILDSMSLYGGYTSGTTAIGNKINLKETGPFVGARYGFRIGVSSSITFDVSYSKQNTESSIYVPELDNTGSSGVTSTSYSADTDTKGTSFSITWLKSLDRGRSFFVRLKTTTLELENGHGRITYHNIDPITHDVTINGEQKLTSINFGMGF